MPDKNVANINKENCTACGACENICPNNCLNMTQDNEGFLYPKIDMNRCNKCGKCALTCPIINNKNSSNFIMPKVYAAWSLDDQIRMESSSGGIFTELAQNILAMDGYVIGARYNTKHLVEHDIVKNEEGLALLRKSKYVQSKIGLIFREIKNLLDQDKQVMFVGTPCQTAGLRNFLNRKYEKLLICDLVCHGVNSPIVYLKYLEELESEYKSKVKSINFRDKINSWKDFGTRIIFENKQEYYKDQYNELFFRGFIKNLYLRPSCYDCKFKTFPRDADISLADFWGIEKTYKDLDTKKGVSLIMIHSERGQEYFNKLDGLIFKIESDIQKALPSNPCIIYASNVSSGKRQAFFSALNDGEKITDIISKLI